MFSELSFPQPPTSAFTATPALFNDFLSTLKKRTSQRTPLLDSVLTSLEDEARQLKEDMQVPGLPQRLHEEYGSGVIQTLEELTGALERVLVEVGAVKGDGQEGIEGEKFVGRVAVYLAKGENFLRDIVGTSDVDIGK
jgi:hypothetical protein